MDKNDLSLLWCKQYIDKRLKGIGNVDTTIKPGSIGPAQLADGSVTLPKIASTAFDSSPVEGSTKIITSGGVAEALANFSGGVEMVKLWENASPTSEFAAQTILQNVSSEFEFIRVFFYATREPSFDIPRGRSKVCTVLNNGDTTATMSVLTRRINFTNGVVSVGDGQYKTFSSGSTPTVENTVMVPLIIYGIKGVT